MRYEEECLRCENLTWHNLWLRILTLVHILVLKKIDSLYAKQNSFCKRLFRVIMDNCSSYCSALRCHIRRTLVLESEGEEPSLSWKITCLSSQRYLFCSCAYLMHLWKTGLPLLEYYLFQKRDSQIHKSFGMTGQINIFHIAARISPCLRSKCCPVQWLVTPAGGHCLSPSWQGWWLPVIHTPSTVLPPESNGAACQPWICTHLPPSALPSCYVELEGVLF